MELKTFTDCQAFLELVGRVLEQAEARNSLILGITRRLAENPDYDGDQPYMAVVLAGEQHILHVMMTPPYGIVLAGEAVPEEALALVINDLRAHGWTVPDVSAPKPLGKQFADLWRGQGGYQLEMAQRLYQLEQVIPAPPTPGQLRLGTAADVPLIVDWIRAFDLDAFGRYERTEEQARKLAEKRVEAGDWYIWEAGGQPVSMCIRSRPTRQTIAVTLVYTPPEARRQGYATAMMAAVSQRLLDAGFKTCTLYTDLANPTSNSVYMKVGYQPLVDFDKYKFIAEETA